MTKLKWNGFCYSCQLCCWILPLIRVNINNNLGTQRRDIEGKRESRYQMDNSIDFAIQTKYKELTTYQREYSRQLDDFDVGSSGTPRCISLACDHPQVDLDGQVNHLDHDAKCGGNLDYDEPPCERNSKDMLF